MPGIRDELDVDGHARLRHWLARAAGERFTGTLRVSGSPGGVFQFRDGMLAAARSPGASGMQALLVRSGRVSVEDWARTPSRRCRGLFCLFAQARRVAGQFGSL